MLGLKSIAQAVVIAARALSAGVAFSPEKDGSSFLSGLLGNAAEAPANSPTTNSTVTRLNRAVWSDVARRLLELGK